MEGNGASQKRAVRERYNYEVRRYESARFGSPGGRFFDALEKDYATRFLIPGTVLHIGTATGRFAGHLSRLGFQYTGIEISDAMVRATKIRSVNEFLSAEVVHGDAENPPFRAGSFHNILSVRSFHFLPHPSLFLRKAYALLRPGGRAVVSFELFVRLRDLAHRLHLLPVPLPRRTFHTIADVARLFVKNGFQVIWAGKVTKLPLLSYWRMTSPLVPTLRRIHHSLPYSLGTVGQVVGQKPT